MVRGIYTGAEIEVKVEVKVKVEVDVEVKVEGRVEKELREVTLQAVPLCADCVQIHQYSVRFSYIADHDSLLSDQLTLTAC